MIKIKYAWVDFHTYLEYDILMCDIFLTDGGDNTFPLMSIQDPDQAQIDVMKKSSELFINILKEVANGRLILEKFEDEDP